MQPAVESAPSTSVTPELQPVKEATVLEQQPMPEEHVASPPPASVTPEPQPKVLAKEAPPSAEPQLALATTMQPTPLIATQPTVERAHPSPPTKTQMAASSIKSTSKKFPHLPSLMNAMRGKLPEDEQQLIALYVAEAARIGTVCKFMQKKVLHGS